MRKKEKMVHPAKLTWSQSAPNLFLDWNNLETEFGSCRQKDSLDNQEFDLVS